MIDPLSGPGALAVFLIGLLAGMGWALGAFLIGCLIAALGRSR